MAWIHRWHYAATVLAGSFVLAAPAAAVVLSQNELSFGTVGQSLAAPGAGSRITPIHAEIINFDKSRTVGDILRFNNVVVPNDVAQAIYDTAMNVCRSTSIAGFFPTQTECRTGTVSRTVLGIPVSFDIPGIDGGLGPRPADTVTGSFDIGMKVTEAARLYAAFEGRMEEIGAGGVGDVALLTSGEVSSSVDKAAAGQVVTLSTLARDGEGSITTEFGPTFKFELDLVVDAEVLLQIEAAAPRVNSNGSIGQYRQTFTPINPTTDGPMQFDLIDVEASTAGFEVSLLGSPSLTFLEEGFGVGFDTKADLLPGSSVTGVSLGLPIAKTTLLSPDLDMPSAPNFDGMALQDVATTGSGNEILTLASYVGPTTRTGGSLGIFESQVQDTDFLSQEIDIDFFASLASGVPFGIQATFGPCLAPNPSGGCATQVGVFSLTGNIIDLDFANYFSFDQQLTFTPNLMVDMQFSEALLVETGPGSGIYEQLTHKLVPVGTDLNFLHPGHEVQITPVYTLAMNDFSNLAKVLWTPAFDLSVLSLEIGGPIFDLFGGFGLPSEIGLFNAGVQLSPAPVAIGTLVDEQFSLLGFNDIVGTSFTVAGSGGALEPDGANFVAELTTASPAELVQAVANPGTLFDLQFDYWFRDGTGMLEILLGDQLLDTLFGSTQVGFLTYANTFDLAGLLDGDFLDLVFRFNDSRAGSVLWLDNVVFAGLANGDFSDGLQSWRGDHIRIADAAILAVAVPEPRMAAVFAGALVVLAWGRRRLSARRDIEAAGSRDG